MASVTSTPTSLIAANKRDYLPDKQLHARQLPKDARRDNFGTGVIYTEGDGQCTTIDTAQAVCVDCPHVRAIRRVCGNYPRYILHDILTIVRVVIVCVLMENDRYY